MHIKSVLATIACLSFFSFAQLPTLTIKTKNNQTPVANQVQNGNSFCPQGTYSANVGQQNANNSTSGAMSYDLPYIEATETELSGADTKYNFKRIAPGKPNASDSIRRRGNSTANTGGGGMFPGMGGGGGEKIPFRVKFDKKVAMFGRPAEKSWALLANYYDPSIMQSYLAFYLGRKLGLDFTPNGYYLKLNVAGQNRGVYLLTDQIQRSEASVDIDKEGGWLAEFDYHCATSTADQKRFYHTGANRYNLNTKIREPDLDDLPLNQSRQPDGTCLDFVKSDLNKLLDKMKDNSFPNNGYRDYIDLTSYAKYIMIQLFMDNQDWNGLASSSTLLGSTYAYRNKGEKIKAGPLWDFDLACGTAMSMFGGGSFFNQPIDEQLEPRHDFYKRLFSDPVFQARYKKIWNDNKSVFERVGNTVIDSITNVVASSMAGNIANGVSNVTEQSYRQHTGNLKNWWSRRITAFGNKVNQMNGSDVSESAVASDLINSKMNCREAVSSSSKPSSSSVASSSSAVSSSSRPSSSSANNVVSSSSVNNNGQVTLTCSNLQSSVEKGGHINEPTLTCSNGSQPNNPQWQGRPSCNCWDVSSTTQTERYTISVTATCGQSYNLRADCGTVTVGAPPSSSSSSEDPTPIVPKQTLASLHVQAIGGAIVLENLPRDTKIEMYNLQGKVVYSTNSGNSRALKIQVQTGIYIMRATLGSEKKIQRFVVK
ncbi:MAG: CotH kinase family protein [Fibromonadales bacterium]|nr:CotH kinase family protein [Fibromonadales bacterium]